MEKKTLLISGAILLGAIIIGAALFFALNATAFKVATVDVNEVFKSSEFGQELSKEMNNKMQETQGKLNLAKTDAEKNQIKIEYEKYKATKEENFVKQVKAVIGKVAKQEGVKAVASPQVYVYSQIDMTDAVIKELDK